MCFMFGDIYDHAQLYGSFCKLLYMCDYIYECARYTMKGWMHIYNYIYIYKLHKYDVSYFTEKYVAHIATPAQSFTHLYANN